MKLLKVLTGPHAGARLALDDGLWCIEAPAEEHVDEPTERVIALEDWTSPPLQLRLDGDHCMYEAAEGAMAEPWPDFTVRRFGDTVLCISGETAVWPSDRALMAQLARDEAPAVVPVVPPPSVPVPQSLLRRWRGPLVALVSGGALVLVVASPSRLPGHLTDRLLPVAASGQAAETAELVRAALAAQRIQGLQVQASDTLVTVSGTLATSDDDARARAALQPFARDQVVVAWQVTSDLIDALRSALHDQGVNVRAESGGRFVIEGVAPRPEAVRELASRLAQDLAPGVRSIALDLQSPGGKPRITALMSAGDTRYSVRPDGAKTFAP